MSLTLHDILREKGAAVLTIEPEATLADVVQKLVHHNCGSLVVCSPNAGEAKLLGIITERDILRACAAGQRPLDRQIVAETMSRNLTTGSLSDRVEDVMGVMTHRRIRHLPVVEEERLVGMISIGDLVKAQHNAYAMENHYLKSYIQG